MRMASSVIFSRSYKGVYPFQIIHIIRQLLAYSSDTVKAITVKIKGTSMRCLQLADKVCSNIFTCKIAQKILIKQ